MKLELLLAMIQSWFGLVAWLVLRGRRAENQLSLSQVLYRERTWAQYKLLTFLTFLGIGLNLGCSWMGPSWRLQHLGLCLTAPVFAFLCAPVWLIVTIPVLLRRYNYLTE